MFISKYLDRIRSHRQQQQQQRASMMPTPMPTASRPFVLVPLYIYPSERAWEPLLDAARRYREVLFVAVINPNSGPGDGHLPDGSYTAALARLAGEPNISTLGYVACTYGRRDAAAVEADMDAYRGWWHRGGLRVDGVFFDETPSDAASVPYMERLASYAKETWRRDLGGAAAASCGSPGHQTPSSSSTPSSPEDVSPSLSLSSSASSSSEEAIVVYNPGVVVCADMFRAADYVVVFEASEDQWNRLRRLGQDLRRIDARVRSKAVAIIHSSRASGGQGRAGDQHDNNNKNDQDGDSRAARKVIQQSRSLGMTGVYLTDQQDGGYTRWPASWMKFAEAVAEC